MRLFRDRLRSARQAQNLSQLDLAVKLGVGQRFISNWETGHCMPSFRSLMSLATTLGVSVDWLMGLTEGATDAC